MRADIVRERAWTHAEGMRAESQLEAFHDEIRTELLRQFDAESGPVKRWWKEGAGLHTRCLDSWTEAHKGLAASAARLQAIDNLTASISDDEIQARADLAATHCIARPTLALKIEYVERHGIEVPHGPNVTARGLCTRFNSPDWWVRKFRRMWGRQSEDAFRQANFVNRHRAPYVSELAVQRYRDQRRKGDAALMQLDLLNETTAEVCPLVSIVANSMANPAHRNAELMTHARGLQEYAQDVGHTCLMVTATTPSRFHASLSESGARNPTYWEGGRPSPREAQAWLSRCWARARAAFKKENLRVYGWRVAEPHHDGTPHWHLIIYCDKSEVARVQTILRKKWLRDSPAEPGAQARRILVTEENPAKGSGVGYLAKYVAKNLEGAGSMATEGSDETALPAAEASERAVIWSRLWGIRQFQSFGQPVKSLWRTLRRVREVPTIPPLAHLVNVAAHTETGGAPDYRKLIWLLGGHAHCHARSRMFLDRDAPRTVDPCGRNVLRATRWGELPADRPVGLICVQGPRLARVRVCSDSFRIISRLPSGLGPVALTVDFRILSNRREKRPPRVIPARAPPDH